jgi:hypothetical protein
VTPDFFIVGAPKCGTTALHSYLRAHPEIFMPQSKDRCYFGADLITRKRLTPNEFASRFSTWSGQKRIGESCVHYIYSKQAPLEIKSFNPDAQIIIMLRNPVDMLYSWHSQLLYLGSEDIPDFQAALAAEPLRQMGKRIPRAARIQNALYYRELAKLSDHVRRYFDVFGEDRTCVVLYDDFAASTPIVYKEVLSFLGVDSAFELPLQVVNANKKPRNLFLHKILTRQKPIVRALGRMVVPGAALRQRLLKPIQRWNKVYDRRPPMASQVRHRLQEELAPVVSELSGLLQRDLSHWSKS